MFCGYTFAERHISFRPRVHFLSVYCLTARTKAAMATGRERMLNHSPGRKIRLIVMKTLVITSKTISIDVMGRDVVK